MKALRVANEKSVIEFLNERLFSRYGVPREILIDQDTQFTYGMIKELRKTNQIRNKKSTPYHPQANGQVEVTNREVEKIMIKKF